MWKLFLDDVRNPDQVGLNGNEFYVARSFEEAVNLIVEHNSCPSHVAFDHDLSDEHYGGDYTRNMTGYHFAKFLIETDIDNKGSFIPSDFTFSVHSMNPEGAKNIHAIMTNWLTNVKPTYWG